MKKNVLKKPGKNYRSGNMNELDNCNSYFRVYIKLMGKKLRGQRS